MVSKAEGQTGERRAVVPGAIQGIRRVLPILVGAAALAGLVVAVNPRSVAGALSRFNPFVIPVVILLSVSWYVLQGVRWHFLLCQVGAALRLVDTVLLSIAGQTITALFPLGDLTRAVFAADAAGIEFGTSAATVTVQELTFTLLLVLIGIPGMLALHVGTGALVGIVVGMVVTLAILTVSPLFRVVHTVVSRLPLVRRLRHQIAELQEQTVALLHRPSTLGWSALDLARAAVGVTLLWAIVEGLEPGAIGWWETALVVAVAYVGGAVSFLPGGTGASDASLVGLLVVLGVHPATAGAAAILQRLATTGVATSLGFTAYLLARRRFALGGLLMRRAS
ncbi:MAG TPA: lysylphosphatidylglycerol synthase transmembrane domain-containing protein [Candidatus Dormibacteraeota bacterium]|nr:lysylphosphatidylglycerol synthase transmembrane domain-containing protein [Candidatus Dormibacteraeota bacterium]